jgi:hypothetical protein
MMLCAVQQFVVAQSSKSNHRNVFDGMLMVPMDQTPYQNSQSIILDWWTDGMNYHLFCGGKDENGKTGGNKKSSVWQQLSDEIKKQGIIVERSPHHVGMKINKMEGEFGRLMIE